MTVQKQTPVACRCYLVTLTYHLHSVEPVSYTHLDVYKRQPPPQGKVFKVKRKCHCNKRFITNKLKLQFTNNNNK